MGKLNKQIVISILGVSLSQSAFSQIPEAYNFYDVRPKNSFRGGSRGKGGKIKYARR